MQMQQSETIPIIDRSTPSPEKMVLIKNLLENIDTEATEIMICVLDYPQDFCNVIKERTQRKDINKKTVELFLKKEYGKKSQQIFLDVKAILKFIYF